MKSKTTLRASPQFSATISSGVAVFGYVLIQCCINSIYYAKHPIGNYSSILMESWIVLALFVIALFASIGIKQNKEEI